MARRTFFCVDANTGGNPVWVVSGGGPDRQPVPRKVDAAVTVGDFVGIVPSIAGQAWMTGYNTIFLDDRDPFVKGSTVT